MMSIKTLVSYFKATPNYQHRTFTLRRYTNGELTGKYRTIKLTKDEFESCLNNTNNDWKQFLKTNNYYLIK